MLLHVVSGPNSFDDDLRTVDGVVCETQREACYLRGLLEDDQHLDDAMNEVSICHSPSPLRLL
jgi:hypothetical protein